MRNNSTKLYGIKRGAFTLEYLRELSVKITESPYLGNAPFTKNFVRTKGFSLVFTREKLSEIEEAFPYLKLFLESILFDQCNAFFVNSLVLNQGSRVDSHIDCRILPNGTGNIVPNLISVLYVQVPNDLCGGELLLETEEGEIVSVQPSTNTLVNFRGDLVHSVNELQSLQPRISLVCEQYRLDKSLIESFPNLKIIPGYEVESSQF